MMSGKATQNTLDALHDAIAKELLRRVESGEASAGDLQAAIRFLKDNGVATIIDPNTPAADLLARLPFDVQQIQEYQN